jgi:hypothetical protein
MPRIRRLARGIDVSALSAALDANPQLWNEHTARTASPASPHHGLDDIWARWAAPGVDGSQPHDAIWYPAADLLPIRDLVYPLMSPLRGDKLGGVLITRIPPGAECKPHADGGWHAGHFQKFGLQIKASAGQAFCFEGERLETEPGDLFWFDNAHTHWVPNPTPHERITAIVCIKTDLEF